MVSVRGPCSWSSTPLGVGDLAADLLQLRMIVGELRRQLLLAHFQCIKLLPHTIGRLIGHADRLFVYLLLRQRFQLLLQAADFGLGR